MCEFVDSGESMFDRDVLMGALEDVEPLRI